MASPPRDKRASEFGGRPGLIQPDPHEPTPSETLMQIYATETAPILPEPVEQKSATPPSSRPDFDSEFIPTTEKRR